MHKLPNGNWQENRIPRKHRPCSLPAEWGAHFFAADLVARWKCESFLDEEEPLYAVGITAYQYLLADGPPWTCFRTHEFDPFPTYESDAPIGTAPEWRRFDVETFADFLAAYEGGCPPGRVAQILKRVDILADYLCGARAIDDAARCRWVEDAKRVLEGLVTAEAA